MGAKIETDLLREKRKTESQGVARAPMVWVPRQEPHLQIPLSRAQRKRGRKGKNRHDGGTARERKSIG